MTGLDALLDELAVRAQEGETAATADDLLSWCRPLLVSVVALHERQRVMDVRGGSGLLWDGRALTLADLDGERPRQHRRALTALTRDGGKAVEVVSRYSARTDLDTGDEQVDQEDVVDDPHGVPDQLEHPVHVAGLRSWEQLVDHHDSLVDIAVLGQLMLALATGLDPREPSDFRRLVHARENLGSMAPQLHPVAARVLREMTDLDRHRRSPDLNEVLLRLEGYREVPDDFSVVDIPGYGTATLQQQRRLLHTRLRERLFDTSRRNQLLWFAASARTLDLTVASVPQNLDHRSISPDSLLTWRGKVADTLSRGRALSLTSFLRIEESPYLAPTLDKIISAARRDRAEYGFAQLRLVTVFLRWHDLKGTRAPAHEVIESPLLLLPVELTRKKGVRDSYVLTPSTTVAEVNPALRHQLQELYGLVLPETVDLSTQSMTDLHAALALSIRASEPAVELRLVEKPQIDLVQRQARLRSDAFRRRRQQSAEAQTRSTTDHSYDRADYRPLGIQLFHRKVLAPSLPQRVTAGGSVAPVNAFTGETEQVISRKTYALRKGATTGDPYDWAMDLCKLTVGNFSYRRMSLVHDYDLLIEDPPLGSASEVVFHEEPRELPEPKADDLVDLYPVVASDATQLAAVARARDRSSYVIQGPPGTGKSQTITNLIADQVSLGRSVLFVCEKRAAVDVVYSRLRQRGLEQLCCLVHDAQGDKRAFLADLKAIYEGLMDAGVAAAEDGLVDAERVRQGLLTTLRSRLANLQRLSHAMASQVPGAQRSALELIDQLVRMRGDLPAVPELTDEQSEALPSAADWWPTRGPAAELERALDALGEDPRIAGHYVTAVGDAVLLSDRPARALRSLIQQARVAARDLAPALEGHDLPLSDVASLAVVVEAAAGVSPLARAGALDLLGACARRTQFDVLVAELRRREQARSHAWQQAAGWWGQGRPGLDAAATAEALKAAQRKEGKALAGASGAYRRARAAVAHHFTGETPDPKRPVVSALELLSAAHAAEAAVLEMHAHAERDFALTDLTAAIVVLEALRAPLHGPVAELRARLLGPTGAQTAYGLAGLLPAVEPVRAAIAELLVDTALAPVEGLEKFLDELEAEADLLPPLLSELRELAACPRPGRRALLELDLTVDELGYCTARAALAGWLGEDRAVARLDGTSIDRSVAELAELGARLCDANAAIAKARVRRRFLQGVAVCSRPVRELDEAGRELRRVYLAGRRDLEHEFGKVMRHKPVRTLAEGPTGRVLRDLKPVWLMSPLSVSDTLPLDPGLFDVVIFDEASQVPVEEAVPALFRARQVVVVGDQMQLPPSSFFSATKRDEGDSSDDMVGLTLEGDSFLTQAAATLPSTLLAWHYRSRSEALIGFSNAAFYGAALRTVPDRDLPGDALNALVVNDPVADAATGAQGLLDRPLSSHLLTGGVYASRRNASEARYIAGLLREVLARRTGLTVGIVAFSEAQQSEIEDAIEELSRTDKPFAALLDEESTREVDGQQVGLFVKNLENVQGDERDIIILSICYGRDPQGRMRMNFGPVNQQGGEKRLNVIFSRAKRHMAVVTSMRHPDITNTWNDGASALARFLRYAEAASIGDNSAATRVLRELAPAGARSDGVVHAVVEQLALALRARGHVVELHVGQSSFRVDLAVRTEDGTAYALGVLVDTSVAGEGQAQEQYVDRPRALAERGWTTAYVLAKDWLEDADLVLARLEQLLSGGPVPLAVAASRPRRARRTPAGAGSTAASRRAAVEPDEGDVVVVAAPAPAPAPGPPRRRRAPVVERPGEGVPQLRPVVEEPAVASSADAPPTGTRRFELVEGASAKFWEIWTDGSAMTVRFGRLGTQGQTQAKDLGTAQAATLQAARLVVQKLAKGYLEVG